MSSDFGLTIFGNRSRRRVDDLRRLVDRERRLGDEGDLLGIVDLELVDLVGGLDEDDAVRRLAGRPLDLLVALVADQDDRVALVGELARLDVDLGDQRAGRVDRPQPALGGVVVHRRGDAVGGEDDHLALRHLGLLVDEDRAALAQLLDDVLVVDDLLAHVDRRRRRGRAPARPPARHGRRPRSSRAEPRAEPSSEPPWRRRPGIEEAIAQRVASGVPIWALRVVVPDSMSPQSHLDRLSSIDASFLTNESLVEPHARRRGADLRGAAARATTTCSPTCARGSTWCRASARSSPSRRFEAGRPLWVDDPDLQPRATTSATPRCPRRAPRSSCATSTGRVFSQPLDRSKPLWELWLVQGLEHNRFALLSKTHHALVDGVSGVDIATVLFDVKPVPEPAEPRSAGSPSPSPRRRELVARGVSDAARRPAAPRASGWPARSEHPERGRCAGSAEALEGVGEVGWNFANPAPDVPLNVEIGSHRRFVWVRSELADFKRIKDALGGTVNDVVLAVVSGRAARVAARGAGSRTEGLELRALVPVSIRAEDERGQLGNRIAAMRGPLPVYVEDPVRAAARSCARRWAS